MSPDRKKLIEDIERALPGFLTARGRHRAADALLAAGWRHAPTDGPEFDAMVERATTSLNLLRLVGMDAETVRDIAEHALRAALGGPDHG